MRSLITLIALLLAFSVGASEPPPKVVSVSVDADLLLLVKWLIWGIGIFLAAFAFIGVAFFGWDVRKARTSILDAQKETKDLLLELRKDSDSLKELKEKLQQLGAQLEDEAENFVPRVAPQTSRATGAENAGGALESRTPVAADITEAKTDVPSSTATRASPLRSPIDLIRNAIARSNFEWTTIERVMKRTSLILLCQIPPQSSEAVP